MRILIDIGHPGHVHYFRNAIKLLTNNGHKVLLVARDREFIFELLKKYSFQFVSRGKGSNSALGKFLYMLKADMVIYREARKFNPDMFLSFSSPYAAQVAYFMRKPHIAINDTEHEDSIYSVFTYPFSSVILTPKSFLSSLGKKQIRFDNLVEGFYLHKNYFMPSKDVMTILGLEKNEKYVLFRFVSWQAHHDFGQKGMSLETKLDLIDILKKKYRVFISSEKPLPEDLAAYQLPSSPEMIHDVIYHASLFVGESSTMASESALLGTNAVFINSLPLMCNIKLGQDAGLIRQFKSNDGIVEYVQDLLSNEENLLKSKDKSAEMQKGFIDATKFLVWFIEKYPKSKKIMKDNPDYQYKFV